MQLSNFAEIKGELDALQGSLNGISFKAKLTLLTVFTSLVVACTSEKDKTPTVNLKTTPAPVARKAEKKEFVAPQKDSLFDAYQNINEDLAKKKIITFLKKELGVIATPDEISIKPQVYTDRFIDQKWYEVLHTPKNASSDYKGSEFTFNPPSERIQNAKQFRKIPEGLAGAFPEDQFFVTSTINQNKNSVGDDGSVFLDDLAINRRDNSNPIIFYNRYIVGKSGTNRYEFVNLYLLLTKQDNTLFLSNIASSNTIPNDAILVEKIEISPDRKKIKIFGKTNKKKANKDNIENLLVAIQEDNTAEYYLLSDKRSQKKLADNPEIDPQLLEKLDSLLPKR